MTQNSQTIIAHPDTAMMAVTLDAPGQDSLYANVGKAITGNKSGVISIKGDNGKYYVTLNQVANTDWYLVTYITENEMLADLYRMEIYMVIIAGVAAVILLFAVMRVTNRVVKPVAKVTNVIGEIAEGDFTHDLETSGHDEIAVMTNNMQLFISKMRNTISEISDTAVWLNKQSVENEKVSNSLMESSQDQTKSMEILNELAVGLSNEADEVASQMDALAELIKQTREDGNTAKDIMCESVVMS